MSNREAEEYHHLAGDVLSQETLIALDLMWDNKVPLSCQFGPESATIINTLDATSEGTLSIAQLNDIRCQMASQLITEYEDLKRVFLLLSLVSGENKPCMDRGLRDVVTQKGPMVSILTDCAVGIRSSVLGASNSIHSERQKEKVNQSIAAKK
jgi:hypothetical protein